MSVSGEAGRAQGDPTLVLGPVGRLGLWTAGHFRAVLLAWIVIAVGLGAFAPRSAVHQGAQVGLCGTCMDARGIDEDEILQGARRSSLEELTDWTLWADQVVTF